MDKSTPKHKSREGIIQEAIIRMLRSKEWFVKNIHGSAFQSGLPDLYASHVKYRIRWIEVKDPSRSGNVFTPAQTKTFPQMSANGSPVWILTAATETEYNKLFEPENWWTFLHIMRGSRGTS